MVDEKQTCYTCNGRKTIDIPFSSPPEKKSCPTCNGRGFISAKTFHPGNIEDQQTSPIVSHQIGEGVMSGGRVTPIFHTTRQGKPTFAGMQMQGIFQRSQNPMTLAWRLLKSPEGPWFHGTSRMNQVMQEGLQPKGRVRYPDNRQAPSPALFFTSDPREARGFATQSKSRPNERPGVVRVQNLEGKPIKMGDGHRHIIVRKPVLRDRFEEVDDDAN